MMTINFKRRPRQALLARVRLWALCGMALLLAAVTAAAQAEEVERCKTNTTFKEQVVHFPVRWGLCVGCHKFENGARPFTLREDIPKLCIGCHGMKMKDELGQTQPSIRSLFEAAAKPPEEGGMRLHKPFADGNCTCCHNPHTSSDRRMLDRPYPTTNYYDGFSPERFMCFKCHNERAFTEPRTLDATRFRNGNLNLHFRHVNRDKGRSCRLCHEHHASTYDALIRKEAAFGTKVIPISEFSRTENGGSCAPTCHVPVKYNRAEAELNTIRTTPREGEDVPDADLLQARTAPPLKANYPPKKAAPKTETPAPEAPAGDTPNPEAPAGDTPNPEAPAGDTPKTDAPAGDAPKTDAPAGDAPKTDAPAGDAAKTDAPAGDAAMRLAAKTATQEEVDELSRTFKMARPSIEEIDRTAPQPQAFSKPSQSNVVRPAVETHAARGGLLLFAVIALIPIGLISAFLFFRYSVVTR